jgi:hypothetical protein
VATTRKHPETAERHEPVITYSRVVPRGAPARSPKGARPMEIERIDPFLAETAVPLPPPRARMGSPARMDTVATPEPRAEVFDLDETIVEESDIGVVAKDRRPRSAMFLIVGAVVAIAAGICVLLVSFNAATLATVDPPSASENVSAAASSPAESAEDAGAATNDEMIADIEARLAALEGKAIPADERPADADNVRQVSLSPGETVSAEDQAAAAPAAPPPPRLRPERVATATPADTGPSAEPTAPARPAPQAARPAATGDDDFIASIERALADNPAAPAGAGAAPALFDEPGLLSPGATEDGAALDMLPAPDTPVPPEPIPDVGSIQ